MKLIDEELFGTVHRAKKINSKVKGNRSELVVSKLLTDWLGTEVVRVPQSGGLHWQHSARVCGDVIVTDPTFDFPFSIETKSYKNVGLTSEMPGELRKNSVIYTFFEQCQRDAKAAGKIPLLIVRQNGMPKDQYYIFLHMTFIQIMKVCNYIHPKYHGELSGFKSKEFFEQVSFETLKWIYGINK
jgi:hypothetical protein